MGQMIAQPTDEHLASVVQSMRTYLSVVVRRELSADIQAKISESDVLQDTFLEAWRDAGRFRGSDSATLSTWLRRILRNNVRDARRRYGRQKRCVSRELPLDSVMTSASAAAHLTAGDPTPSQCLQKAEQLQRLSRALALLPADYRQVLGLRHWDGLSFADIGRRMDRSEDAARKLWGRALCALQQTFKP